MNPIVVPMLAVGPFTGEIATRPTHREVEGDPTTFNITMMANSNIIIATLRHPFAVAEEKIDARLNTERTAKIAGLVVGKSSWVWISKS
jgi:hypothetical protein